MVRRAESGGDQVLAAVNADFFDLKTGENENNQVLDSEWWKGVKVTESPYDTFDNTHSQFGLDSRNRPLLDRFQFAGELRGRQATIPLITLNARVQPAPEGTALFTSRFGSVAPGDTGRAVAELPLAAAGRRGDTLVFVRRGPVSPSAGSPIPPNGAVLAGYGPRAHEVASFAEGETLTVVLRAMPRPANAAPLALLVGGWPRIVRDGASVAAGAASQEGTISHNAEVRNPRTAIGFTRDSTTLVLVTVDGRSATSAGMTLVELAALMRELGAWQALNFDGGGSTTMIVEGRIVNSPSDTTGEREVGDALLVLQRDSAHRKPE
jgi:phosphodiester glycosidase